MPSAAGPPSAARACRCSRTTRAPGGRSTTRPSRSPPSARAPSRPGMAPLVSHGLYLINLGAPDREVPTGPPGKPATTTRNIYRSSIESLVQHLTIGEALGLAGGRAARRVVQGLDRGGGDRAHRRRRRRGPRRRARRTAPCSWRTPPAPATPSAAPSPSCARSPTRSAARSASASAWTRSTCSRPGYPVHEPGGIDRVLEEFDLTVGIDRLRCLHLNDSKTAVRLQPRPAREHRRRRDRRGGHAQHPGRARPPGPARDPRGAGPRRQRARTSRTWPACAGSTRRAWRPADPGRDRPRGRSGPGRSCRCDGHVAQERHRARGRGDHGRRRGGGPAGAGAPPRPSPSASGDRPWPRRPAPSPAGWRRGTRAAARARCGRCSRLALAIWALTDGAYARRADRRGRGARGQRPRRRAGSASTSRWSRRWPCSTCGCARSAGGRACSTA